MHIRGRLGFALVLFLIPATVLAQRATTGTVAGKVVDSSGAVLPGVAISLQSAEVLGQFSAISSADGTYRVVNLPPATYEVRAELSGFQTIVQKVIVRLNGVSDVTFTMAVGSVAETVTVTGEAPIVDPERAGLSVNINNQALTSVPVTTNRRFQDAWLVVPGVAINPATQELTGSERRTSLDGADVTDPFGGDIFAVNLNYDAIQDVEIKALGAEAADGSSMVGQFMNIVTKSGGNDLHGSAAFFVIPESFNTSNVDGIPANNRKDIQPDFTLGGPIARNHAWFFGSYRRVQSDKTLNNAPVPVEGRGNLWFMKGTTQMHAQHRLSVSFQYDKTTQGNAVIRGTVAPSRTLGQTNGTGLNSATMQISAPSAFGNLTKGGPLASFNYNWVMSSNRLFQFVGSFMFNKPNDYEPIDGLTATKVIQSNPTGNILGSLTTIAQEGGFGATDTSHRSMTYLSPSMTFMANRLGSHEFRGGADLYPNIENDTSSNLAPVEYYFRPPGTTGSQDVLFERDTLRNLDGNGATIANKAYEHHYAMYFQDRWKPSSKVAIKAGVRVETNKIFTADREKVLGPLLAPGTPTNISDLEFHQWVTMPNFGIAYNAGDKWGVFRGTMGRSYEWLDLGGGDGTSHAPYVLATDVLRANPRTSPTLNQSLPGGFPLGLNYGGEPDDSIHNGRTYVNEFSGSWEHRLPRSSSLGSTFVWRRNWDYQSGDDQNVTRDPVTGALTGRPFPQYDAIRNTYNPNYTWQQQKSLQFLFTRNFVGNWGVNANYSYIFSGTYRTRWNPTSTTDLQFLGISPEDVTSTRTNPRNHARLSTFFRLPWDSTFSVFYIYTGPNRQNVMTGDFPLNATAPSVTLSNGRVVSDTFFNIIYPRARMNDVDMLTANDSHLVNLRLQKDLELGGGRKLALSADVFNLFNVGAYTSFLSNDVRSTNFGKPTNYVQARVGQLGLRLTF